MAPAPSEALPVARVSALESSPAGCSWLIEGLWTRHGVGLIGGSPKCCKTWLALDLAVSVASGTAALGRFSVPERGHVLFYGAEDEPSQLRSRVESIAASRQLDLQELDLGFILSHVLRLDTERDRCRLAATIEHHRPRLLVLDPFVRLHRLDENSAGEISSLLADLRSLQRRYELALIVVHHLRKHGGPGGQALRGSGDLHAWGDSNLFLRRRERQLVLTAEHRSQPPPPPCTLALCDAPSPHLVIATTEELPSEPTAALAERVLAALAASPQPLGRESLRQTLRTRNETLGDALARLRAERRIERRDSGFALRADGRSRSHP